MVQESRALCSQDVKYYADVDITHRYCPVFNKDYRFNVLNRRKDSRSYLCNQTVCEKPEKNQD